METQTATETTAVAEPSMAELRTMFPEQSSTYTQREEPKKTTTTETPSGDEPVEGKKASTEPVTEPNQQQEEAEEELPEGVRKKIEKETKKQAFFQSKIDQAVSARKAKEAEATALDGKSGSEPAKTNTEPDKSGARPTRPDLDTFPGTLAEYKTAVTKYETDFEAWVLDQTKQTVSKEFTERQVAEALKQEWDAAAEEHGADFPAHMETLKTSTPEQFQIAVSGLDNWAAVAVHLAKNEAERNALVEKFKTSPYSAIAELGKLEARLTTAATKEPATTAPAKLPAPLKPVAGGAKTTQVIALGDLPMDKFKQEMGKLGL